MPSELHLDPDRLHAHASAAAGMSEELRGALHGAPDAADTDTEQERLRAVVGAAVRELAGLSAALAGAASAASSTDAEVGRSLREILGRERA
ncbi:hypothetical protein [Pseudonocardia kunmingensis]|uniref:Uncharacterized protein n=1 Tax=Pseudonocardia kunmingensis TaxID=630975 RepID=A0A543E1B4_9PSEU|nr:hypothetical protein [Pseudonocardia kunmingensis]TQM15377.1 hypothetical protein FB558_2161 [Pseudonocardia kunmingensis]